MYYLHMITFRFAGVGISQEAPHPSTAGGPLVGGGTASGTAPTAMPGAMLRVGQTFVDVGNAQADFLRRAGLAGPGPSRAVDPATSVEDIASERLVPALPLPSKFAYLNDQVSECRTFLAKKEPTLTKGPGDNLHLGPPPKGRSHTLVLDMDQTMLTSQISKAGASTKRRRQSGGLRRPLWEPTASIDVDLEGDGTMEKLEVWYRPGLMEFLATISQRYEIVIFSHGERPYVETTINRIVDPDKKYISHIFARDNISWYDTRKKRNLGIWAMDGVAIVKDISGIFKGDHPRRPERVVCMDDDVSYFVKNLEHVVSVRSFHGDAGDKELEELGAFLMSITDAYDVRDEIRKRCNLPAHVGMKS